MESLESRIERLTPEQRREVEDFVDFLLLKNNFSQAPSASSSPPPVMMNAPPVLFTDPIPTARPPALRMQDLVVQEEPRLPAISDGSDPSPVHEIAAGDEDWITRDYMDYGRFKQAPSPATEAVKNMKRETIARETEDRSRHLFDWVD